MHFCGVNDTDVAIILVESVDWPRNCQNCQSWKQIKLQQNHPDWKIQNLQSLFPIDLPRKRLWTQSQILISARPKDLWLSSAGGGRKKSIWPHPYKFDGRLWHGSLRARRNKDLWLSSEAFSRQSAWKHRLGILHFAVSVFFPEVWHICKTGYCYGVCGQSTGLLSMLGTSV